MFRRLDFIQIIGALIGVLTGSACDSIPESCGKVSEYLVLDTIEFAGREWDVKNGYCSTGQTAGPGPCYYCGDGEDIWVDATDRLHMKVNYKSALSHYAAVSLKTEVAGCGKYTFKVANGPNNTPDGLDKNMVLGLFTYEDNATYENYEIDIETSDWGQTTPSANLYYVTWHDSSSHSHNSLVTFGSGTTTHSFEWMPSGTTFVSKHNSTYVFDGNHGLPYSYPCPTAPVKVRMNLWMYEGVDPAASQEVIIEDFEYEPLVVLVTPSGVSGELDGSTATLYWIDNSSAEAGTEIERKVDGGSYSLLDTADPDEEFYEDIVNPELTYFYRLRTKSGTGEYSEYSSEVEVAPEAEPSLSALTDFSFDGWSGYVEGTISDMPAGSYHVRSWVETNRVYQEGKDLSPDSNGYFYATNGLWGSAGPTTDIWVTLHPAATDVYGTGDAVDIDLEDWPDEAGTDIWVFGPFPTQ